MSTIQKLLPHYMFTAFCRLLYRIFSFLSDKTNGKPLFVKYKMLLGVLLIPTIVACDSKSKDDKVMCYDISTAGEPVSQRMVVAPETEKSISSASAMYNSRDPEIMCYKVAPSNEPWEDHGRMFVDETGKKRIYELRKGRWVDVTDKYEQ
jgi:hypothetical protein